MNGRAQHPQPRTVTVQIFLRAIEVELELLNLNVVSARIGEELRCKIDNCTPDVVIGPERSGKWGDSKRDRAPRRLSSDRLPIDRRLNDLRVFSGKTNFGTKQNDAVHAFFGLANCVNHCWGPFALPEIPALSQRTGNLLLSSITTGDRSQRHQTNDSRSQIQSVRSNVRY